MKSHFDAWQIIKALARRHRMDAFFTEVKNGPTQTRANHNKIDALAIKLSWTQFNITGYEVKVSRSDFMRDSKWQAYLPMCNQLYFAVAPGVCEITEVPDVCGLVRFTANGGLRTLKKAPWREIEPPVEMYKYLLFSRVGSFEVQDRMRPRSQRILDNERIQLFKDYVDGRLDLKMLGYRLGKKVIQDIADVKKRNAELEYRLRDMKNADDELTAICRALDVTSNYEREKACLNVIEHMRQSGGVTPTMANQIAQISAISRRLAEAMNVSD